MNKPVLFSGIQPSGKLNIGNYIGALKNWVELQDKYDCLFSLVDLHAITVTQDPKLLRERCYEFVALYIACGLDPEKNIIFVQSHAPAHSQLTWVLNCFTYMGELNRMTQFKDKSKRHNANINVGLFDYPALMAADILLYNTNLVPVGHDQKQHLELARDLSIRFNNKFGDIFTVPEPYIPTIGGRIMGLQTPENKMSKSDVIEANYVALLDDPKVIMKKFKRAVTDSETDIRFDPIKKAGVSNLITILSLVTNTPIKSIEKDYAGLGYGKLKMDTGEAIIEFIRPLQEHYKELRADEEALRKILHRGAIAARERSEQMIKKVYDVLGFIPE